MENNLFQVLKAKENQFVQNESSSIYRPKSTILGKKARRVNVSDDQLNEQQRFNIYQNELQFIERPASQQTTSSKSSKRLVYLHRNGKKPDQFDTEATISKVNFKIKQENKKQMDNIKSADNKNEDIQQNLMASYQINGTSQFYDRPKTYKTETVKNSDTQGQVTKNAQEKARFLLKKQKSQGFVNYPIDGLESPERDAQIGSRKEQPNVYSQTLKVEQSVASSNQIRCYSDLDPSALDTISLSDPIWMQILPEDLIDKVDIQRLIEENPEYFNHHLGFCACFKCKCGSCKCDMGNQFKLNIGSSLLTTYGKDFGQKKNTNLNNIQPLNSTIYETRYLDQKTIDLQSTSQESFKPSFQPQMGAFTNLTSYKSNFGNWGVKDFSLIKRPPHISTSDGIPFVGKTSYQETFCQLNKPRADIDFLKRIHFSPLPTGPFMGQTTFSQAFTPFKISQQVSPRQNTQQSYNRIPTFAGQFKTTASTDYLGDKDQVCPAANYKKMWKQQLIQKYQQIRDNRLKQQLQ